jgi:hypothetical protein
MEVECKKLHLVWKQIDEQALRHYEYSSCTGVHVERLGALTRIEDIGGNGFITACRWVVFQEARFVLQQFREVDVAPSQVFRPFQSPRTRIQSGSQV